MCKLNILDTNFNNQHNIVSKNDVIIFVLNFDIPFSLVNNMANNGTKIFLSKYYKYRFKLKFNKNIML